VVSERDIRGERATDDSFTACSSGHRANRIQSAARKNPRPEQFGAAWLLKIDTSSREAGSERPRRSMSTPKYVDAGVCRRAVDVSEL
jgi:hypothetical protein